MRGLFWAGVFWVLGSGDSFFFRVSRGFLSGSRQGFSFSRAGCSFFKDRAGSGLFPGQGQSKIVKVFLSAVRQSKVVKILLFRARSRQGLGSLFVERVKVFFLDGARFFFLPRAKVKMLEARVKVSTLGWMSYSLIVEGRILDSRRYCLLLSGIKGFVV